MTVPQKVKLARHPIDLDDDGHHHAEDVIYDPTSSGLSATDVQAAIDEVAAGSGTALTVEDEGTPLAIAADTLNFVGAGVVASGTGTTKTITIPGGASALDDLTDVTLTTPAVADRLRFDGSVWRNSALLWRPSMVLDPTSGNYLPVTTGDGDAVMVEA